MQESASEISDNGDTAVTAVEWIVATIIGAALSLGVWWDLANGSGLVGGDIYPYFLPQKMVMADAFAAGELPFWHDLTGLGYPLHAESQAGVFYPPNQILYRIFDLNTAYNANILLHYWLAFLFTWRLARAERVSNWPALLAGVVFVYGWFPVRISWEWSIIGGVWLPLTLWLTRRLIDRPSGGRFAILAICLGVHLLAGHFTLAFINHVAIAIYSFASVWRNHPEGTKPSWRIAFLPVFGVVAGILVAAIQLVPTLELKTLSQREQIGEDFNPAYGHMPPVYATQVLASWYWHSAESRAGDFIQKADRLVDAGTNPVEAHLYWGLLPLGFICLTPFLRKARSSSLVWWLLLLFGGIYATGLLLPVTQHLPGFGFFRGPGRFTILCAISGAILAGKALSALCEKRTAFVTAAATIAVAAVTLPDVLKSAKWTCDAVIVETPPIDRIDKSWVREYFEKQTEPCRLLAPGPNVGNLFGVSCVPQYLGIGPEIYYDELLTPPTGPTSENESFPEASTLDQLNRLGITHILTTEAIANPSAEISEVLAFPDALLNSIWGRGVQPCYLYRVNSKPPRVVSEPASALTAFTIEESSPSRITASVTLDEDAKVVIRDLMYPGWTVSVDGNEAEPLSHELSMRSVEVPAGTHEVTWMFEATSTNFGAIVSMLSVLLLGFVAFQYRRPEEQITKEVS